MGLAGSVEAFCFYEKRGRPPLLIIHSSSPDLRKIERLASFRQRDPRIAQAFIMFALLGVVFFLRQRCAPGRRFPCGLALGSHLLFHFLTSTFFTRRGDPSAMAANLWPPPSPSNRRNCGYRMPSIGSSWIDQFLRLASRLIPANEARAPLLYARLSFCATRRSKDCQASW